MSTIIYSGSFDPIHSGHALIANYVSQLKDVDKLILMISKRNPLKSTTIATDQQRIEMANLVVKYCEKVEVSALETKLPDPSYTYNTLSHLREKYKSENYKLLIGGDNWSLFHRWKNYEQIIKEFGVIVYPRPGYKVDEENNPNITFLKETPQIMLSSTMIRDAIKENKNINYMVPIEVAEYINRNNLYK